MYVCICQGVTDGQIRAAVANGAGSIRDIRDRLGVMTQCGRCACTTQEVLKASLNTGTSHNTSYYRAD